MAKEMDFSSKYLGKPAEEKRCVDCAYCIRRLYLSGKWPCANPNNHPGIPVPNDKPCFVKRGSKEAEERGL